MRVDYDSIYNRNVADALVVIYDIEPERARELAPQVRALIESAAYMKLDDVFKKAALSELLKGHYENEPKWGDASK